MIEHLSSLVVSPELVTRALAEAQQSARSKQAPALRHSLVGSPAPLALGGIYISLL